MDDLSDSPTPGHAVSTHDSRTPLKTTMRELHIQPASSGFKRTIHPHYTFARVRTLTEVLATKSEIPWRHNPHVANAFRHRNIHGSSGAWVKQWCLT